MIEMRRLLPVVTAHSTTETMRLLDDERKTVARVEWSKGTANSVSTSGRSHPEVDLQPTLVVAELAVGLAAHGAALLDAVGGSGQKLASTAPSVHHGNGPPAR